jgi:transcriptional regulator with XRE-family HTH domain
VAPRYYIVRATKHKEYIRRAEETMKNKEFIRTVKDAMGKKGLGLRELSRLVGIDHGFLSKILNGERNPPSDDLIRKMADVLGVDFDRLMLEAGRATGELKPALAKEKLPDYLRTIGKMSQRDWKELSRVIERHLNSLKKGRG